MAWFIRFADQQANGALQMLVIVTGWHTMPCCRSRSIQYCLIYGNVRKYILQRRTGYVKSCEHIARGDTFIYYFRTRYPNFYCFGEITKSEICSSNLGFSIESPLLGLHCSQYRQYYFFSNTNNKPRPAQSSCSCKSGSRTIRLPESWCTWKCTCSSATIPVYKTCVTPRKWCRPGSTACLLHVYAEGL